VDNPEFRMIDGKETLTFIISVHIINSNNKVVGGVGCVLNAGLIQPVILNTVKTSNIINVAAMYSDNGTILAHFIPERVGKKIFDVDVELGNSMPEVFMAIQNESTFSTTIYDPNLSENIGFVLKSFEIGNSGQNLAILLGASESYIFKEIKDITRDTIILAVLVLAFSGLIVYFAFCKVTKPIVKATEIMKGISEGHLTRKIAEHGNDEITDIIHYFNKTLDKLKHLIVAAKGQTITLSGIGGELAGNMTKTAVKTVSQQAEIIWITINGQGSREVIREPRANIDISVRGFPRLKAA
jgi:methyl-accepting chemotaxis protein